MTYKNDLNHKLACFLNCELDCSSGRLYIDQIEHKLEPLVYQFLLLLIQADGQLLSKAKLVESLWHDTTPSDETVRALVKKTREILKDDARKPIFIKTIPKQGYLLIPKVTFSSTLAKNIIQKYPLTAAFLTLLVTIALCLIIFYFFPNIFSSKDDQPVTVKKLDLGIFSDEKVGAHYHDKTLFIFDSSYSYEEQNTEISIVDLVNNQQNKIVISDHLHERILKVPGKSSALVMRNDLSGVYQIDFEHQFSFRNQVSFFALELNESAEILDVDSQAENLIMYDDGSLIFFSIEQNQQQQVINLEEFIDLTEHGRSADWDSLRIWPQPQNNQYLLALSTSHSSDLFSLSLDDRISVVKLLTTNRPIHQGVWNEDGTRFSFSDTLGQLYSFVAQDERILAWMTGDENLSSLVADCGEQCFVVSDTEGRSALTSLKNPFGSESLLTTQLHQNLGATFEHLPNYSQNELYYVTYDDLSLRIEHRNNQGVTRTIKTFGRNDEITELAVNENASIIAGVLNQRLFTIDTVSEEIDYVSISSPSVSFLHFQNGSKLRFYSQPSNAPEGVYEYDLVEKKLSLERQDVFSIRSFDVFDSVLQQGVSGSIAVNNQGIQIVYDDGSSRLLSDATSNCINCIHVRQQYVYYISNEHVSTLSRLNLVSGELTRARVPIKNLLPEFSISNNSEIMSLTSRREIQTRLSKMEGFQQIY